MIKKILKKIYFTGLSFFVDKNLTILRVDGGICSQIQQFVFGQLLDKSNLKYNNTWFSYNGYDMLHKDKRNYDLEKLFPYLNVPKASFNEVKFYREKYVTDEQDIRKIHEMTGPVCLDGYYSIPHKDYQPLYNKFFNFDDFVLDEKNAAFAEKIRSCKNTCGVHVRRGDLADVKIQKASSGYSHGICSDSYFFRAVEYISQKIPDITFFFFSDDVEYVKNNLIPNIKNNNCIIADINSPEDGYYDLYLLAQCHHQIGSIGSLGVTGHLLNKYPDKILVTNNDKVTDMVGKCVLLDNDGNLISTYGI